MNNKEEKEIKDSEKKGNINKEEAPKQKKEKSSKTDKKIEELKTSLEKEKEKYLRLFAEFENYKKRTTKERIELFKTAAKDVITDLLPVIDDLERALAESSKTIDETHLEGFQFIEKKLHEVLKSNGLETIEVNKEDVFNSEIHEAVSQLEAGKEMKGKIIDIIQKGYALGEKTIRYPKVIVGL